MGRRYCLKDLLEPHHPWPARFTCRCRAPAEAADVVGKTEHEVLLYDHRLRVFNAVLRYVPAHRRVLVQQVVYT